MSHRLYDGLTLPSQIEKIGRWKDPLVFANVATFMVRGDTSGNVLDLELPLAINMAAENRGRVQAHRGGFTKPSDVNLIAAAMREFREETGLEPTRLKWLGAIGPCLPRSTMRIDGNKLILATGATPAYPHPIVLNTFMVRESLTEKVGSGDGEMEELEWLSIGKIIERYGMQDSGMTFNYFVLLYHLLADLAGQSEAFPVYAPESKYILEL